MPAFPSKNCGIYADYGHGAGHYVLTSEPTAGSTFATCRSQVTSEQIYPQNLQIRWIHYSGDFKTGNVGCMIDPLRTQGIARTSTLLAKGWSRHRIVKALESGQLIRPRLGWVAKPTAEPALLFAAQHGLLLGCITQAKRLGLWVRSEPTPHFSTRANGTKARPVGVLHWHTPLIIRDPDVLEDPLVNVLDTVARCQPFEEAVAIWDSALNKGLIEWLALSRFPFIGKSKLVLASCNRFADSGLESYVRTRLAWMRVRVVAQAWIHGHRVDFLLGQRLILQIDGSQHTGAQRTKDGQHDAKVSLLGYAVIRVTYAQVMHDWPAVQQLIMEAIAQGKHLAT